MHMLDFKSLSDPKLVELLKDGAVGVLPTDTVYGLVCLAADKEAIERLYKVKPRDNKPGTLVAADIDQFVELGIPRRYIKAYEQFWPNPISIETPHDLAYLHRGTGRQALRIPSKGAFADLLRKTGSLQTTSANMPSKPPATTITEAQAYFGDTLDFYVDGGDLSGKEGSTIIRVIDDAVEVIRDGAIKINERGEIEK